MLLTIFKRSLLTAALVLGLAPAAQAQEIVIKLGTLVPQGSPWHKLLNEGSQRFRDISGGKVTLRTFAGGTLGNEGDMVKKMRIGQLQAAALSTVGLHEITPEPLALDLPLMIQTTAEKQYVLDKLGPKLEAAILAKGYVVLNWSEIGFLRFFTTEPRPTLAKMRDGKLFAWEGDPASVEAMKAGGFHPVVLSSTDIIPSLQTGMINTVVYPPTYAMSIRLNDKAKYMQDLVWGSFTGALVVKKDAWDKIPEDVRGKLREVTRELGARTTTEAQKMEADSLTKMKAQGLTEVHVTDAAEWQKVVEQTKAAVRGKVVPAETYDEVLRLVQEFRQRGGKH